MPIAREDTDGQQDERGRFGLPSNVVIPTRWLIGIFLAGLINLGIMYQQFQQLREDTSKTTLLVGLIRENQIKDTAAIANLKSDVTSLDGRLARLDQRITASENFLMDVLRTGRVVAR